MFSDNKATGKWKKAKIRRVLGPTLAIAGLLYTYRSHLNACPRNKQLDPPVWLIFEHWLLFDRNEESSKDFETFKHNQSLARNLWVGFLIFLAAFYSGVFGE